MPLNTRPACPGLVQRIPRLLCPAGRLLRAIPVLETASASGDVGQLRCIAGQHSRERSITGAMVGSFLGDAARRSSGPVRFIPSSTPTAMRRNSRPGSYAPAAAPGLICYAKLLCAGGAMAKLKQLNIGLTPVQYAAVSAAAEAEGETVTAYSIRSWRVLCWSRTCPT